MNNQEYEIVNYNENICENDIKIVNEIYNEAFPDEERDASLNELIDSCKSDKRFYLDIMYADPLETGKKQVVAFSYYFIDTDFIYGIYLAIKKDFRSKGYGNKFIDYLKDNYTKNKHFFLCAEKVEDIAENKEQRIKREAFFHKLGFSQVETDIELNGVNYDFYSLKKVTPEEVDHYLDKIQEAIVPDYYNEKITE